jgi:hypothetical protein
MYVDMSVPPDQVCIIYPAAWRRSAGRQDAHEDPLP